MMKNLASAFVSELTDIESSMREMSDVRDMLISSFEHAYTSAFFDGSKMTNSSFETMLNTRIEEVEKEEEIARRVAEARAADAGTGAGSGADNMSDS
jgi:flagellar hook-basal body complex protein FliE